MIYKLGNIKDLISLINNIKKKTFSIETQYKFLKILKVATEEQDIIDQQQIFLLEEYAERDEANKFIMNEDGGFKIKPEYLQDCAKKMIEINNHPVQFPDIYFSLDELEPLGLTLGELELLESFVKI